MLKLVIITARLNQPLKLNKMETLTSKQAKFVDAYIITQNATESARRAGYKGNYKVLGVTGSDNLKKPCIQAAIANRTRRVVTASERMVVDVYAELSKNFEFVSKLRDACQAWLLLDDTYSIAPRTEEVDVVHVVQDSNGNDKRITERLDILMSYLEGNGYIAPSPFIKTVDIREYALKTVDKCETLLDKFAKLGGLYVQDRANPVTAEAMAQTLLMVNALIARGVPLSTEELAEMGAASGYDRGTMLVELEKAEAELLARAVDVTPE